jgi:phosphatidylethanolamine N-methyltransferase
MVNPMFRASDFKLVLLVSYAVIAGCLGPLASHNKVALYFGHALAWRFFHSFGLGLLLRAQSDSKFLVRHYIKNYHYPSESGDRSGGAASVRQGALIEAFNNWKDFYNLSLCMTYGESAP